jgi:CO dehydrogenase/acetyl-CoA synthase gamma subunit (corrinoid Fe-S protein)
MELILELLTKNPKVLEDMITSNIERYKPLVYAVAKECVKVYADIANNKDVTEAKATSRKNQYDAYLTVGFTEEQALSLLLTDIRQVAEFVKSSSTGIKRKQSIK